MVVVIGLAPVTVKSTVPPNARLMAPSASVSVLTESLIRAPPEFRVNPLKVCVFVPVLTRLNVPPFITKALLGLMDPAPPAVPLFDPKLRVLPGVRVVAPVYAFTPYKSRIPGPVNVRPKPEPLIGPPTERALVALRRVMLVVLPSVIVLPPKFSPAEPIKAKSLFHCIAGV